MLQEECHRSKSSALSSRAVFAVMQSKKEFGDEAITNLAG
jgi:hypothetical protein